MDLEIAKMEAIMKVGPKGQVVIPQEFRHALNIYPGSKVLFRLTDKKLDIKKPIEDAVSVFRETAKGMGKLRLHPHEAYEEEMDERIH
jgi:AbrB family looped-hinge helix DNA binding protein